MSKGSRYSGEHGSQWAAIGSIVANLGCTSETLRSWVRQAEGDAGQRPGQTTDERQRRNELERENHELRRVNDILARNSRMEFSGGTIPLEATPHCPN